MSLEAGKYLGSGLGSFDVNAEKNALKGKQKATDAINTAKGNAGAELAVIDAAGNTTVHKVSVEKGMLTKPKPTASGLVTVDNLAATNAKVDKNKPLAIDPGIAGKLGGDFAVLVDEKNQTTVIGSSKNAVAEKYLTSPTAQKVDAAYAVAGDDNFVNKKMASNVINKLSANYRNTGEASHDIGLLKDGQVKTVTNSLIGQLNTLSANTAQLETERKNRDAKFNGDIVKPQERLNKANQAWTTANNSETQKVNVASENLREAQFPGVHEAESSLEKAKSMVNDGKNYLQNAAKAVTDAKGEVGRLETLRSTTTALSNSTQDLIGENKKIVVDMAGYLVNRRDQLNDLRISLNDKAQYYQSLADMESRKPAAPANAPSAPALTRADADKIAASVSGGDGWVSKEDLVKNGLGSIAENGALRDKIAGSDNKISVQEFSDGLLLGTIPYKSPNAAPAGNSSTSDPFAGGSGNSSASKPNSSTSDPFASGGGNTGSSKPNSATSDPFASGGGNTGSSKPNSATSDPFASGGNSGSSKPNSATSDPFSSNSGSSSTSGQYKNNNALEDFRRRASETRADANTLDMRVQGLNKVINEARRGGMESSSFRQAISSMPDNYNYNSYSYVFDPKDSGYNYFNDQNSDKGVIVNNYVKPYDDNNRTIRANNQTIQNNVTEYKSKIDYANQRLEQAKVNEAQASGNLSGAQATVTQVTSELQRINSKAPVADSAPSVKATKSALDNAQKHMDSTVGENAPLTKEKNAAQGAVNDIKESHDNDVKAINDKITNNANQAQQQINATKKSLGI